MTSAQPARSDNYLKTGIFAAILIVVLSFLFCAAFSPAVFGGWVTFIWITAVPALLIIGLQWHYDEPGLVRQLSQPGKGMSFLGLTAGAMVIGGAFLFFAPGRGAGPSPMLINATIMSVVATFWVVSVWRCWPLTIFFKQPVALGIAAWVFSYLLGYALFEWLFDFGFAKHAAFYARELDPAGLFNAWSVLVFFVTTTAFIVILYKMFEYWPIVKLPAADRPVVRGLYASGYVLLLSAAIMGMCVGFWGIDIVDFMVRVPVAIIFGAFLVTNLMQFRLFAGSSQPAKGFKLLALAVVSGGLMEEFYRASGPWLVRQALPAGPPHYQIELWVASALLAVTFPLIIIVAGFFDLWPLKRALGSRDAN